MLANQDIANLRQIALDDKGATTTRRLAAIDSLAALGNHYLHKRTKHLLREYVEPTRRGRLFLVKALRRLKKSKKHSHEGTKSAVNARLLFLRGVELGNGLWQLKASDGQNRSVVRPVARVPDIVSDIENFLTEHGG